MSLITFNAPEFRKQFPAFKDSGAFSDPQLQTYFDLATNYISNENYGWIQGSTRAYGLNLMTAHLAELGGMIANGDTPGIVTSSSIDRIAVTLVAPDTSDAWRYWLNLTPYGQQYLAMLSAQSAGGLYIGGSDERGAFRKSYGRFGQRFFR